MGLSICRSTAQAREGRSRAIGPGIAAQVILTERQEAAS